MNKNILNEINVMKYLFDYRRGVVISEQKKVLSESVWPIDQIAAGLKAGARGAGTKEQYFAQWLRGLVTFQDIKDINKYFSERGDMSLEELIYDEFDADDDEDQYWLKKFDEHFADKGIKTNFLSGQQGPIEDPGAEVPDPRTAPELQSDPSEVFGSAPSSGTNTPIIKNKAGWDEIVKHYNATPYDKTWKDNGVYKLIDITHDDKKFILRNDGQILNFRANKKMGDWSWENDEPVLTFDYKVTNPATGFVSGDPEGGCQDEFCTNKKVAGRGATGYCVKMIQSMLLNSGLVDGIQLTKDLDACKNNFNDCDGIYGRETEKAVRKFQEENNISVDGIVGCETWGYL